MAEVDFFEDADKVEYSSDNGNWTVTNDTSMEGSYLIYDSGSFCQMFSYPGDGLPNYIPRGTEFHYFFKTDDPANTATGVYFGAVNDSNNYFTRYNSADEWQLVKKIGGSNTSIVSKASIGLQANTRYRVEVVWDDGTLGGSVGDMTADLYNDETNTLVETLSGNSTAVEDNTGSNGEGIGWWKSGSAGVSMDALQIPTTDSTPTTPAVDHTVTKLDDFEDGDVLEWTDNGADTWTATDMAALSGSPWSGTYAAHLNATNASTDYRTVEWIPSEFSGGHAPNSFTFYWWDSATATSFSFFNSAGERELSVGANHRDWTVSDSANTGFAWHTGDGDTRWIRYEIRFDWPNDAFTVYGYDTANGKTDSYSGNLIQGGDIETIAMGKPGWAGSTNTSEWHVDYIWDGARPLAPSGLSISEDSAGVHSASWTDEAALEDAYDIYYAREYADGRGPWNHVSAEPADTTGYSHDNAVLASGPNNTSYFKIHPANALDDPGDLSATTGNITASLDAGTASDGNDRRATDWSIELVHPNASPPTDIVRPNVLGDVQYQPTINGLPRIRVPVPKDDLWLSANWERADMRVWKDGRIYPIERVEQVETYENKCVIVGVGGVELYKTHVETASDAGEEIVNYISSEMSALSMGFNGTKPTNPPNFYKRMHDGTLLSLLNDGGNSGNYIWEVRVDPQRSDETYPPPLVAEFARPGDRSATTIDQPVLDFQTTKTLEEAYEYIEIFGPRQRVEDERVYVNSTYDAVYVNNTPGWQWNHRLTDLDGTTEYNGDGSDYEFNNPREGKLIFNNTGALTTDTYYHFTYDWTPKGSAGSIHGQNQLVESLAGIEDGTMAQEAADWLHDKLSDPRYLGEVTIPYPEPDQTLVTDRIIAGLPSTDAGMTIEAIDHGRDSVTLTLGSRGPTSEIVNHLESQLGTLLTRG